MRGDILDIAYTPTPPTARRRFLDSSNIARERPDRILNLCVPRSPVGLEHGLAIVPIL